MSCGVLGGLKESKSGGGEGCGGGEGGEEGKGPFDTNFAKVQKKKEKKKSQMNKRSGFAMSAWNMYYTVFFCFIMQSL